MYSSWWKPEGSEQNGPTDHEALHRDEVTHKAMQSDDTVLRPLDLETIMSSKAAVKFWYLHRPQTMAYVHQTAVKMQSLGRSFAVRRLIKQHGIGYTVQLAKVDAAKKEDERIAALTPEELQAEQEENARIEALRVEKKLIRNELALMEQEDIRSGVENAAYAAYLVTAIAVEKSRLQREHKEMRREDDLATSIRLATNKFLAIQLAGLAAEDINMAGGMSYKEEQAILLAEAGQLAAQKKAEEEKEAAAAAAIAAAASAAAAEKALSDARYEKSFGLSVPVLTDLGVGNILGYKKETGIYTVKMMGANTDSNNNSGRNNEKRQLSISEDEDEVAYFEMNQVSIDENRILSPKTQVMTPFGVAEVIGMDAHMGCYALRPEGCMGEEISYVQINNVERFEEKNPSVILGEEHENLKMPDEIGIVSARVVDSRIFGRVSKKFVQYKLEIQTNNYGTLFCWKRYSTFRLLCDRLRKEKGVKKRDMPDLPHRTILGNFSERTIGERAEKLNQFLEAAVKSDHLQWGIKVDDEISVYKRRVKVSSSRGTRSGRGNQRHE